jgi:surface polysaccharide O-acyltransferase-like enzyme
MPPKSHTRSLRWYAIPVRVLLMTFIGTLIAFAIFLFFAIIGTVAFSELRGTHPNMTIAYRRIALPSAVVAGSIIFVLALAMEIRHYRQSRALSEIERVS